MTKASITDTMCKCGQTNHTSARDIPSHLPYHPKKTASAGCLREVAAGCGSRAVRWAASWKACLWRAGWLMADPHPGNLIRTPDGRLSILDFGLMVEIDDDIKYVQCPPSSAFRRELVCPVHLCTCWASASLERLLVSAKAFRADGVPSGHAGQMSGVTTAPLSLLYGVKARDGSKRLLHKMTCT